MIKGSMDDGWITLQDALNVGFRGRNSICKLISKGGNETRDVAPVSCSSEKEETTCKTISVRIYFSDSLCYRRFSRSSRSLEPTYRTIAFVDALQNGCYNSLASAFEALRYTIATVIRSV